MILKEKSRDNFIAAVNFKTNFSNHHPILKSFDNDLSKIGYLRL